ncbi:MAG: hypothetical protein KKI15_02750 [Proteobacteria bacterium]|nr:hypothetical protein [Pseudomonadota bacterium]
MTKTERRLIRDEIIASIILFFIFTGALWIAGDAISGNGSGTVAHQDIISAQGHALLTSDISPQPGHGPRRYASSPAYDRPFFPSTEDIMEERGNGVH